MTLITWRRLFWTILVLISMGSTVGCFSQPNEAESPVVAEDSAPTDPETTAIPQEKQTSTEPAVLPTEPAATPTTEPAAAATETAIAVVDVTATAVSSATPTFTAEPEELQPAGVANADVLHVLAKQVSEDTWQFSVTVEHPDAGWEDYADGWDVVFPDGSVALPDPDGPFTRLLLHPHETEQPFTRSQGGIVIAPGINEVAVRAHDLVDGFGGREVIVDLMSDNGQDYEVQRLQQ